MKGGHSPHPLPLLDQSLVTDLWPLGQNSQFGLKLFILFSVFSGNWARKKKKSTFRVIPVNGFWLILVRCLGGTTPTPKLLLSKGWTVSLTTKGGEGGSREEGQLAGPFLPPKRNQNPTQQASTWGQVEGVLRAYSVH